MTVLPFPKSGVNRKSKILKAVPSTIGRTRRRRKVSLLLALSPSKNQRPSAWSRPRSFSWKAPSVDFRAKPSAPAETVAVCLALSAALVSCSTSSCRSSVRTLRSSASRRSCTAAGKGSSVAAAITGKLYAAMLPSASHRTELLMENTPSHENLRWSGQLA
jgi:hypothetical protein